MIEDFNGASPGDSLGDIASWTKWGLGGDLVVNTLFQLRSNGTNAAFLNDADLGSAGVDVSLSINNTANDLGIGGVLAMSDSSSGSDGYYAYYALGKVKLVKNVSGSSTTLGETPVSLPASTVKVLRYTIDSSGNHEVSLGGVSLIAAVDTTYSTGKVGIRLYNDSLRVDDFTAVALAAGADTTPPVITRNGIQFVNMIAGSAEALAFTVAAATAEDDTDGAVTVTVGGDTYDANAVGTYVFTFDAQDSATPPNTATQLTQTVTLSAAPSVAPAGVPVVGAYSVTDNSISVVVTYGGSDATGLECSLDGGSTVIAFTSPADINSLAQNTTFPFIARAVNGVGPGDWSAPTNIKTDAEVLVGVRGDAVPARAGYEVGDDSGSVIYKHLNLPADAADIWRAEATAPALAGLTLNQDGSYFVTGLALGVHEFGYSVYKNNVLYAADQVWHININPA
jgi:hypothetical protein